MRNFSKPQKNEVTGNMFVTFSGELVEVSDVVQHTKTESKTPFRFGKLKFYDDEGVEHIEPTLIWEGNYKHGMVLGANYNCRAEMTSKGILIITSHLNPGVKADASVFGFENVTSDMQASLKEDAVVNQ